MRKKRGDHCSKSSHLEIGREWAEGSAEDFHYREGDWT
jgi:hypothetical protein